MLTHPALLVVDEIDYLSVTQDGAILFFQLFNARHERASTARGRLARRAWQRHLPCGLLQYLDRFAIRAGG